MQDLTKFEFDGDQLELVRDGNAVAVVVRRVCEALGLQAHGQAEKLKSLAWARTQIICAHDASGRVQELFCLDLDSFPMWLATINPGKVHEDLRPKLVRYQKECAQVLRDHFFGKPQPEAHRIGAEVSALLAGIAAIADGMRDLAVAVTTRLDAVQAQIDDIKKGGLGAIVTKAQADFLLSQCRSIAATYYTGRQAKSVKAALCSVHNRLRKELEWFGTGRTFRMLPATRYADAMVELSALRREANAAAQAMGVARQVTMYDVIERAKSEADAVEAALKAKAEADGSGDKH